MALELQDALKTGKKQLAVWGIGYIGYSSLAHFAREGIKCVGGDISKKRVDDINISGKSSIPNIEYWLDFDVGPLTKKRLISATNNLDELIDDINSVHLIAVPTEKNGAPHMGAFTDTLSRIFDGCRTKKFKDAPLVIIESTISPNVIDGIIVKLAKTKGISIGTDIRIGVAPRRDWFVSPDKTLRSLPRIVGGFDETTTNLVVEVLSIVCDNLLPAKDAKHACLVKSVENAFRQLDITFANQLSLAYPDLNILEVLKLAGTKWNIETYHPSFGVGGYCIPLAPYYVIDGAEKPDELTLLKASIKANANQPKRVAQSLKKRNVKSVGILGLAYTGDIKVDILSPTISIVNQLKEVNIPVKVNDPLYTQEEIKEICDVETFSYPNGMDEFEVIIIVSSHSLYVSTPTNDILKHLSACRLVLDNMGAWRDKQSQFRPKGIEYHEAGDAKWL